MGDTDSHSVPERTEGDRRDLLSTKPLHRFVQREPKSLGVVICVLGSAELLMGFVMFGNSKITSCFLYIPFWQGALFVVCGSLSIYTGTHPSKKMVTVCLSMYLVSLFGILFSFGSRVTFLILLDIARHAHWVERSDLADERAVLLISIECLLFVCSVCAFLVLLFMSCVARLALKSTRTQLILHQIQAPVAETSPE